MKTPEDVIEEAVTEAVPRKSDAGRDWAEFTFECPPAIVVRFRVDYPRTKSGGYTHKISVVSAEAKSGWKYDPYPQDGDPPQYGSFSAADLREIAERLGDVVEEDLIEEPTPEVLIEDLAECEEWPELLKKLKKWGFVYQP